MAKFIFKIYSPYVGADVVDEIEIDDEELESLTEEDREAYIDQAVHEWMLQTVEYGWEEIDD